ncbi:MAG: lactate racemase domain-containing protein [Actinobacteria bacterium]|nr:lactate racemase domain-containing protein [Actinomycetota bacterium]
MSVNLLFGDDAIDVALPDRSEILSGPASLSPLADPAAAVRDAIANPVAHEPLRTLVGPSSKVTIAFDDLTIPVVPAAEPDFRFLIIPIVLGELHAAGVKPENVRLIVANALHRKWTRTELATALGPMLSLLPPQRLYCHDACDPDQLVYLGETERGFEVEVNRAVVDSDLLIYVNATPSPMNGGWKSVTVGLSSFRSIRHHHRPFPFARGHSIMDPERSAFQKLLGELGAVVEKTLAEKGRRIFQIETVLTSEVPGRIAAVVAGHPPQAHAVTLQTLKEQQMLEVPAQFDVGIWGLPNRDPYSALSRINPILVANLACSYTFGLYARRPLVREGGYAIFANPVEPAFERHHRSYPELFNDVLPRTTDPFAIWDEYAEDFANRPEYVYAYRYQYSFHGAHPLFLWGQTAFARRHLGRIVFAGAKDRETVERMGFSWAPSVEDAVSMAESDLGADCSIGVPKMPPVFIPSVGE